MEIRQYLAIVLRWLWLLILGLILGAGIAFGISIQQDKAYQSSTRVQVMSAPSSGDSYYSYYNDQMLAKTYAQTLTTQPMLDGVESRLGIPVERWQIKVKTVSETQLIDISVEYANPQFAADIANNLVEVFAEMNNVLQASRFLESEESLQGQIDQMDDQIQALQAQSSAASSAESEAAILKAEEEISRLQGEIINLQTEIDQLTGSGTLDDLSSEQRALLNEKKLQLQQLQTTYELFQQIYSNLIVLGNSTGFTDGGTSANDKLQSTLALYEQIRANLLASYEDVRLARLNSTSNIVQIEPAVPNYTPIRPQTARNTAMGGAVGLLLAAMIIFLIEYLDDTLKSSDQIVEKFGLPVIGYIADMEHEPQTPYVAENPRSPVSESFRTLRTNLEFAAVDTPLKTLLIVSANPAEGKSTIAVNLAVTIAQGGKHVLLIDADLRRPRIHKFFSLSNRVGLSDYFRNSAALADIIQQWKDPNLAIITSGGIPPNPADLLASKKMVSVLDAGKNTADIVIVDAPPFLVADASILASHVDGVLLVVYPGKTPLDAIQNTLEQMNRAGAHIVGVVMNRISRNRGYYGGYRYYSPYYQGQYHYGVEGDSRKSKKLPLRARLKKAFGKPKSTPEQDQ